MVFASAKASLNEVFMDVMVSKFFREIFLRRKMINQKHTYPNMRVSNMKYARSRDSGGGEAQPTKRFEPSYERSNFAIYLVPIILKTFSFLLLHTKSKRTIRNMLFDFNVSSKKIVAITRKYDFFSLFLQNPTILMTRRKFSNDIMKINETISFRC